MRLAKEQFLQIKTALLDGYDRAGLRRLLRLGLDTALDEITAGPTDSDVVFDVIEWAERTDQAPALIAAAAEHNPQNAALQQLQRDAAHWFAPAGAAPNHAAPPASASAAPPPAYTAGGDVIVATIGAGAKNVTFGKNVTQKVDDSDS